MIQNISQHNQFATKVFNLLTTPCFVSCTLITEEGTLNSTLCYLTCTMITGVGTHYLVPYMCHENIGRYSAQHTLLHNIYYKNRGRHSAQHTLLHNVYYKNRGRHSAQHTLLHNVYYKNRGRHSAHHTLLSFMYDDDKIIRYPPLHNLHLTYIIITQEVTLLIMPCYFTYTNTNICWPERVF